MFVVCGRRTTRKAIASTQLTPVTTPRVKPVVVPNTVCNDRKVDAKQAWKSDSAAGLTRPKLRCARLVETYGMVASEAAVQAQRVFRGWRVRQSALFYRPAALAPPDTCKDDCARVLHVAKARVGTGYWACLCSNFPTFGTAMNVAALVSPQDLDTLQRDRLVWPSALASKDGSHDFFLPVMGWLFAMERRFRRTMASLVLQQHAPANCSLFIYTTLYAAGCISRAQCERAVSDPTKHWLHLGQRAARPIDERPPHPGDILFFQHDDTPYHVALCIDSTTFIQLAGGDAWLPRRVEQGDMAKLRAQHGTPVPNTPGKMYSIRACSLEDALAGLRAPFGRAR